MKPSANWSNFDWVVWIWFIDSFNPAFCRIRISNQNVWFIFFRQNQAIFISKINVMRDYILSYCALSPAKSYHRTVLSCISTSCTGLKFCLRPSALWKLLDIFHFQNSSLCPGPIRSRTFWLQPISDSPEDIYWEFEKPFQAMCSRKWYYLGYREHVLLEQSVLSWYKN